MGENHRGFPAGVLAPGARTRQAGLVKSNRHLVSLDDEAETLVVVAAGGVGMTVSAFLAWSGVQVAKAEREGSSGVLTRTQLRAMGQALLASRRMLANMANNLNQIARALNAGKSPVSERERLAAVLDGVERRLGEVDSLVVLIKGSMK